MSTVKHRRPPIDGAELKAALVHLRLALDYAGFAVALLRDDPTRNTSRVLARPELLPDLLEASRKLAVCRADLESLVCTPSSRSAGPDTSSQTPSGVPGSGQPSIKVSLRDVVDADGSVKKAIEAATAKTDWLLSGVIGPVAVGPEENGHTSTCHDINTYAARALSKPGIDGYMDSDDGRVARMDDYGEGRFWWGADSEVELVCPSFEEAVAHPYEFREMLDAARDDHNAGLDTAGWTTLVESMRKVLQHFRWIESDPAWHEDA